MSKSTIARTAALAVMIISMVFLITFITPACTAATITVPSDQPSISAAIVAASDDDTIRVDSGTYTENLDVDKRLTLIGVDTGDGMPVIDGSGSNAINVSADYVEISGFRIINASAGIYVAGSNANISGNVVNGSATGIYLHGAGHSELTGNTAYKNSQFGILLDSGASYNELTGNTVFNNSVDGIKLTSNSNYNNLTGNTANNNTHVGVMLDSNAHNNLTGNVISGNGQYCVCFSSSTYNNLTDNTISHGGELGIFVYENSNYNNLTGNTLNNNTGCGIKFMFSYNNYLWKNTIRDNGQHGIYIYHANTMTFWLNNFSNPSNVGWDQMGSNTWNSTTQLNYSGYHGETYTGYVGNHWSNYVGSDQDSNAIGDSPHTMDGSNIDRAPLLYAPPPVAAFSADATSGVMPLTVQFTDASLNDPTAWQWTFGDGSTSTVQSPTHTYSYASNYTVTLKVTNGECANVTTKTDYITVEGLMSVLNTRTGVTYRSIQGAVDAAEAGDIIQVNSSTYRENVDIDKTLTLTGVDTGDGMPVIDGHGSHAITVSANYVNVSGFNLTGATGSGYAGLYVTGNNASINDCIATGNYYGLYLYGSSGDRLFNNTVCGNTVGIELEISANNQLIGNTASHNSYVGIYLTSSTDNAITANEIADNSYGIRLQMSANRNIVSGNTVTGSNTGVSSDMSSNNRLYMNRLSNSNNLPSFSMDSIYLNSSVPVEYIYNGTVFTNYVGNYWSGYSGTDGNGDGIGDTTYRADMMNTDNDPLMAGISTPGGYIAADVTSGTLPLAVQFTGTGDGTPIAWQWSFGDGHNSSEQSPAHVYSEAGTYTVTLTVFTEGGRNATQQIGYIIVSGQSPAPVPGPSQAAWVPPGTISMNEMYSGTTPTPAPSPSPSPTSAALSATLTPSSGPVRTHTAPDAITPMTNATATPVPLPASPTQESGFPWTLAILPIICILVGGGVYLIWIRGKR